MAAAWGSMLVLVWWCWQVGSGASQRVGPELDAIQLSIFSHRFMSTAEQMGRSAAANHFSSPPNA